MASGKDYTLVLTHFPATYGVSTSSKHLSLVCVITANVHLKSMSWNIRNMGLPAFAYSSLTETGPYHSASKTVHY